MSRLHTERVRDVVLDALIDRFGDNADRLEDDGLRLGIAFDDGTFVEVKVVELSGSSDVAAALNKEGE